MAVPLGCLPPSPAELSLLRAQCNSRDSVLEDDVHKLLSAYTTQILAPTCTKAETKVPYPLLPEVHAGGCVYAWKCFLG